MSRDKILTEIAASTLPVFKSVKKKRRKVKIIPGSIKAALVLADAPMTGKYSDPTIFREVMEEIEEILCEGLR